MKTPMTNCHRSSMLKITYLVKEQFQRGTAGFELHP